MIFGCESGYPLPTALADGLKAKMLLALATRVLAKARDSQLPLSVG